MSGFLSRLTVGTIGLTCKTFLNIGYCASVKVNGLENLKQALYDERRGTGNSEGRGVITICNHISTLDDPVTWGVLPAKWYFNSRMTRWSLGASDIMFTNPIFSAFFRKGQVLETFRGNGIFQPAVDTAIEKLNHGAWIHLFGEGKVHQPGHFPPPKGDEKDHPLLLRFKWGVGRMLMEAKEPPIIIPMWLSGFEKLMPEGRSWPWKFFPRRGVALSVTFGEPVSEKVVRQALTSSYVEVLPSSAVSSPLTSRESNGFIVAEEEELRLGRADEEARSADKAREGWFGAVAGEKLVRLHESGVTEAQKKELARIRSEVTAVLQKEVEKLGRRVLGLS